VRPVLSKAVDQGAGSGKAILRHRKGMHAKTDVDFQALADNTLADAAAAILAARERFADELQRSTERMAGQGMDTDAILDVLRLDWAKQSRGRISGVLWSGIEKALSGAALRLFTLAELAIRYGVKIDAD